MLNSRHNWEKVNSSKESKTTIFVKNYLFQKSRYNLLFNGEIKDEKKRKRNSYKRQFQE
jgi:hypothetical protein